MRWRDYVREVVSIFADAWGWTWADAMRLPAIEVRPLLRQAHLSRIDATERDIVAARSAFADQTSYRELMRSLKKVRLRFEPPTRALERRADGELKEAIDEVMKRARENMARLRKKT